MDENMINNVMNEVSPETKGQTGTPTFIEVGESGLNRWGQDVFEEFLPILRWPRAAKIYKEMASNDPVITAIMLASRQLIRKVSWRVKPASTKRVDKKAAQFLEECRNDMSSTWGEVIDEITSYFDYGWSYHELCYKKRMGSSNDPRKNSKYNDGMIGWRKIPGRSQESWSGWEFDEEDDGSVIGMYQDTKKVSKVFIPIEKALLFRSTTARGNPEGKSFLRGSYRPWYFKKHIEEIEGIGIERDLAGLPVLTAPANTDIWDDSNPEAVKTRRRAESLIKSVRRDKNEGILINDGWKFELLASGSKRQFDTNQIINRYDQRIAITLLADIVMLGADKVGSFALAAVKKSLLAAALDAQVQSIVNVFNRYAIPRLFAMNPFVGLTALPELVASPVDCPDIKDLAEYINKLSGAGMPLFPNIDLENYLRSLANLPETSEEDPARIAKQQQTDPNKTDPNADPNKNDPNKDGNKKK